MSGQLLTPVGMNYLGLLSIAGPQDLLSPNGSSVGLITLFVATSDVTITNTTTETSAVAAGIGSRLLAANTLTVGRTIRVEGYGVYSAAAIVPGNVTIKVKLGTMTVATTTLGSILSGASSLGYQFSCNLTFRSIGASGTVMTGGSIDYATTSTGTRLFGDLNNLGVVSTVDTTVDQLIDVTVTWATASASNIIKNINTTVEQLF